MSRYIFDTFEDLLVAGFRGVFLTEDIRFQITVENIRMTGYIPCTARFA